MIPDEAVEAAAREDAAAEVARAFANRESNLRALVVRAAGVDPELAGQVGYAIGYRKPTSA